METYTPGKRFLFIGFVLLCMSVVPFLNHSTIYEVLAIVPILLAIFFFLFGFGKIQRVELSNEYLIYYSFNKIKKWRVEEIYQVARMKKLQFGNIIIIYKDNENIQLFSYSDQFLDHLGRIAKKAEIIT